MCRHLLLLSYEWLLMPRLIMQKPIYRTSELNIRVGYDDMMKDHQNILNLNTCQQLDQMLSDGETQGFKVFVMENHPLSSLSHIIPNYIQVPEGQERKGKDRNTNGHECTCITCSSTAV